MTIRSVVSFLVATALAIAGAVLLFLMLASFPAEASFKMRVGLLSGAAGLLAIGGYWLWVDFLAPARKHET
ncbi:MAG: hypothetical protein HY659_15875 [Rhizobiales bacterium]|nr:hypothetical protein [Hyphomicrobiales bacterium]